MGDGLEEGWFWVSWKGRFGVFLRCFCVPERRQRENLCFLTLTFRSETPEKQGVSALRKKHEKFFKKPLASETLF